MIWKLSLTGIKSRLRDYLVLFSGLVMASAIFYMFEAIASNQAFLENNSMISSIVYIFQFGSILLGIITFVYILYANSFLMAMRQKDYAMFMTLGAKGRKIAQMIFIETFTVGIIATAAGSLVGIGLTTIVSQLLVQQLGVVITHFAAFNMKGLIITLSFFFVLFLIAAIANASRIVKKPILSLLRENQTPAQVERKAVLLFVEAVLGVALLAVGYYMMYQVMELAFFAIGIALVTITSGTYLVFHSVIVFILSLLKRSDRFSMHGLNNFTLSQLSFRMREYTQMLSMVAMLVALALGALTVGIGFKNETIKVANAMTPYDLVLNNPQKPEQEKVTELKPTLDNRYAQKENEQTIYYVKEQFEQEPLLAVPKNLLERGTETKYREVPVDQLIKDPDAQGELRQFELPEQKNKELQFVSQSEFDQLQLPENHLQVIQVKDFQDSLDEINSLAEANMKNNPALRKDSFNFAQKAIAYKTYNSLFSGFEFMGFFLGLAFLTMLASCLMFKILSGANSDIVRYDMLTKIGTRQGLLKHSIRKEIGILFLAPGLLGIVHVLFGLQMFRSLLSAPYDQIWLPFLIFFVLYFVYYFLTVWIYTGIVLKRNKE